MDDPQATYINLAAPEPEDATTLEQAAKWTGHGRLQAEEAMRARPTVMISALGSLLLTLLQLAACSTTEASITQSSSASESRPCGPNRYNTPACRQWQEQNLGP